MWHIYMLGFVIGITAAAVPGPINLEVVRRALSRGPKVGAAFGMGAVSIDIVFVLMASMGALALVNALPAAGKATLWLVGSLLLLMVGISAFRAKMPPPPRRPIRDDTQEVPTIGRTGPVVSLHRILRNYFLGVVLTITSPSTIMYWLFTTIGTAKLTAEADHPELVPWLLAAGVATSCTIWVLGAVTIAGRFHRRIQPQTYLIVEHIGGAALCIFAAYSLYKAVRILMGY